MRDVEMDDPELACLRAALGPCWTVWFVRTPLNPNGVRSWSAMPVGACTSVLVTWHPEDLPGMAADYTANLAGHVEALRAELAAVPERYEHERACKRRQLDALLALERARLGAVG